MTPIKSSDKTNKSMPKCIYYEDILDQNNIIFLHEEINNSSASLIIKKLVAASILNPNRPIYLDINSCGGCVDSGLAVIDTMSTIANTVCTVVRGAAASMAAFIAVCGDARVITEHGTIMLHPMSIGVHDALPNAKDRLRDAVMSDMKLMKILRERTKLAPKDYKHIRSGELYLNANQCLARGVVDKVLSAKEILNYTQQKAS